MFGTARLSLLTGVLCLYSTSVAAGTFTVDDLGDGPDVNPGDGVCATAENFCTLRAAIVESNAIAGADTIAFSVAGTISPSSDLPTILQRTTIDGTTAPDYSGAPVVVLDGGEVLSIGLNFGVTASASELIGLKITGFAASGVNISASEMQVHHNYIGPVDGGTPNFDGIVVSGTDNQIGAGESAGNVISGNANDGVVLNGSGHRLFANRIGTTSDGMSALGNGRDGIKVFDSATNIFIGGESALVDHRNVVCGNGDDGIDLQNASNVTIGGNDVGYDQSTQTTIANADSAIELTNANDNIVSVPDDQLTVSGNEPAGIRIVSGSGNVIGLGLTGDASGVGNGVFENATPALDEPIAETTVVASSDFDAIAIALPPAKPATPHRVRTVREPASSTVVAPAPAPAPVVEVADTPAPKPAPSSPPVRPRVAAAPRPAPAPAQAVIAVSKPAPVPEKSQPWNVPVVPVSPRSKLGLMFLAAGTAFAAFLRMIR